ncbi:MAG: Calx-beta domain-containing protein [Flavobacteriaceae bacterium]
MRLVLMAGVILLLFTFSMPAFGQVTYLDNFNTVSYSNNNGSASYATSWAETNETTSPTGGRILINSNQLRFRNLDNRYITRTLDLTGATSAALSLSYNRTSGNESILVQLFDGSTYNTRATLAGSGTVNYNLTAAERSSVSAIRFITGSGNWGSTETIFIDNVLFTASFAPAISVDDVSVAEDGGTATFTATHTGVSASGPFTVNYTTVDGSATAGSDYTANSGTLSFNGSVGDTEQITVIITDDFTFEGDENFAIQLTGTSDPAVDISDTGTGTIVDNESNPNAPRPYEEREARNIVGNFLMRGNTNLQCVSSCPGSPASNNPSVVMGYADVDADATTVNSSYNNFNLPVGATVEWAGLYWGGVYNSTNGGITNPPGTLNIDQVKFQEPGATGYTTINAQVRNIETASFSGWNSFMSHADVTSIVQSGGSGNYFVADIALVTGSSFTGPYGGWTMVVVYADPTEKTRRISVWDGFDFFGFGASESFTVTGILTPGSGAFESHAGYFGMDGEASSSGDFVSINGSALSNALNPSNNTLNGTISEYGIDVGGRNPNFGYSWGIDIDVFDASGLVPNGATSLNVLLGSSSEGIWGGVFVVSNEIAFPAVSSKTFAPTTIFSGDEATVTLIVDNPASGVLLTNFALTDNLPSGMVISPTPDATSSSGGTITAIPGTSTFSISGLNIAAGTTCTFTFDVVTSDIGSYLNILNPEDATNDQNIPLSGISTGSLEVKVKTVITNKRITYRVNPN